MTTEQQGGALESAQRLGLVPADMKVRVKELFNVESRPGFEGVINRDDIIIPRAKLLQGLSDEVKQNAQAFAAGMIINSVSKEVLPKSFVILSQMPKTWIYFNPRDKKDKNFVAEAAPGDVVWQTSNPEDPRVKEHGEWKGDEPPAATPYLNFLCYFEGNPIPVVVGFAKTSHRTGQSLYTMAVGQGGAIYSRKYELGAVSKNRNGNDFFVLTVRAAGKCSDDELEIGKMLYDIFKPKIKDLKVHEETSDEGGEKVPF